MIKIYPSKLNGSLIAPASKAHAQRLLFMAAMSDRKTTIYNVPDCDDIATTLDCLRALGCEIEQGRYDVTISPFPKNIPGKKAKVKFDESATCAKICLTTCAAYGIELEADGHARLAKRNFFPLCSRMSIRGITFSKLSLPLIMSGRLEPGTFILDGSEGSQSISALLMALPILPKDSLITLSSNIIDNSFIDITIDAMAQFGVVVKRTQSGFLIPGKQYYKSPESVFVENDWGLASMWLAAGAASGPDCKLDILELPENSPQNYKDVMDLISPFHHDFFEIEMDLTNSPDIATLLSAFAFVSGSSIKLCGVPQLKFKECDRLETMVEISEAMGQYAEEENGCIEIIGNTHPNYSEDVVIDCKNDPWVFMSMVLASTRAKKPFCLSDENCANKAYRNFLSDFRKVGGKFDIIKE